MQALSAKSEEAFVEVWPENWQAFNLFIRLGTQWNVGMGGRTGLRYEAAYPLIDRETSSPKEWRDLFDDLQVLEMAALKQMSDNQQDN